MKQRTFPLLAVLLLAAALSGCQSTAAGDSAGLSIHFIDPGQTSSALLLCGGQAMLIDGGSAERGSQVAGYLSQQGITYLDYVVCTSADETHMGGLSGPLYTCAVGLRTAHWYKKHPNEAPGGFIGLMEMAISYIQDGVIKEAIGKEYKPFSSYLLTVFFFILINNLIGIIPVFPGGANITGNIAVTGVLALCTFIAKNIKGVMHPEQFI